MTDAPQFRTVLRGFDPEQVAATVKELQTSVGVARRAAAERTIELSRVTEAKVKVEAELADVRARLGAPDRGRPLDGPADGDAPGSAAPGSAAPGSAAPGFDALGARVTSILSLAEAEADQLTATAAEEARAIRQEAAAVAEALRTESEQYAAQVHDRADGEVVRMTSAATATADAIVAQANELAQSLRTEADQRAEAHSARMSDERAQHEAWVAEALSRRDAVHAHLTEVSQLLAVLEDALADAGRIPEPGTAAHG